jgi:hypothetical protein
LSEALSSHLLIHMSTGLHLKSLLCTPLFTDLCKDGAQSADILMSPSLSSLSREQMRIQNIHFTKSFGSCFNLSVLDSLITLLFLFVKLKQLNLSANPDDVCIRLAQLLKLLITKLQLSTTIVKSRKIPRAS